MRVVDEVDPRGRTDWRKPLVEAEAREPRDDLSRADLRRAEGVAVPDEPLPEKHPEERDEERAEQIEEVLVVDEVDDERARRRHRGDDQDQQPLRDARQRVLQRDGGRVDVCERLLRLVDAEGDERECGSDSAGRDRVDHRGSVTEAAREQQDRAERVEPHVRQEVAGGRSPERTAAILREARVVGGERQPGDGHRDHQVDSLPEAEPALSGPRPQRAEVRVMQRPPGEVRERGEDDPERDALHPLADEADRPDEREERRRRRGRELPHPQRAVHERPCCGGDHEHLEDRPAEVLKDVEPGGEVRPGAAERRPQEHHRRHARLRADRCGEAEQRVAEYPADEDREQRFGQRERGDEERARDEHEQAQTEAAPQHPVLERAERPQPVRDRTDAPGRCTVAHLPPFAGMTRIRFNGCDLSRAARDTPVLRVYGLQDAVLVGGGRRGRPVVGGRGRLAPRLARAKSPPVGARRGVEVARELGTHGDRCVVPRPVGHVLDRIFGRLE